MCEITTLITNNLYKLWRHGIIPFSLNQLRPKLLLILLEIWVAPNLGVRPIAPIYNFSAVVAMKNMLGDHSSTPCPILFGESLSDTFLPSCSLSKFLSIGTRAKKVNKNHLTAMNTDTFQSIWRPSETRGCWPRPFSGESSARARWMITQRPRSSSSRWPLSEMSFSWCTERPWRRSSPSGGTVCHLTRLMSSLTLITSKNLKKVLYETYSARN